MEKLSIKPGARFNFTHVEIAARLKAAGFSNEDIGYAFGLSKSTIQTWIKKYPQFERAINEGKEVAKNHIVAKAFRTAAGYEYEESNEKYDKEGNLKERSVFKKHQPPNPKIIMWLLCNLEPDRWKSEHKILVEQDKQVIVRLDGNVASKQIEALAGKLLDVPKRKVIESETINTDSRTISESHPNDSEGELRVSKEAD